MKKYLIIPLICMVVATACKSKKSANSTAATESTTTLTEPAAIQAVAGGTMGTVSHKYKSTGCSTVILVKQEDGELTLIPKDKIAKEFDVDGTVIMFNYHTLKMPQPEGCMTGIPAEITDISKK